MQDLKRLSYVEDGVVLGEFHKRNGGSAIRNQGFQPFKSAVPFLLMRHAVIGDWMFLPDNEDWFSLWARRFGESAVQALAAELRRTDWRTSPAVEFPTSTFIVPWLFPSSAKWNDDPVAN